MKYPFPEIKEQYSKLSANFRVSWENLVDYYGSPPRMVSSHPACTRLFFSFEFMMHRLFSLVILVNGLFDKWRNKMSLNLVNFKGCIGGSNSIKKAMLMRR